MNNKLNVKPGGQRWFLNIRFGGVGPWTVSMKCD